MNNEGLRETPLLLRNERCRLMRYCQSVLCRPFSSVLLLSGPLAGRNADR